MSATVKVAVQVVAIPLAEVDVLSEVDVARLFCIGHEVFPAVDVILGIVKARVAICRLVVQQVAIDRGMTVAWYGHAVSS